MAATKSKEELIDRYVYAVTSILPAGQRADIEQDVRGLIQDMLDERAQGREANAAIVEEVLKELGNPRKLAAQYREKKRYLIGPELFDLYWVVMKVVGFWSMVGITIAFGIKIFLDPSNTLKLFIEYIGVSLFTVVMQVFGWVTIIFAIIEYTGVKATDIGRKKKGAWHPSELPPIPGTGARIRLSGTVVSMMFTIFFFVLFVYSNLFGVHLHVGSSAYTYIPFWDQDIIKQLLPFFFGWLALYILREVAKLIFGQWTKRLVLYTLALDIIIFIMYVFLFADQSIWNPSFMNELLAAGAVTKNEIASTDSYTTVSRIWEIVQDRALLVIAIVMIVENVANFYRATRRRTSTKEHMAS
ncbi:HAAS signaling domain-containing protein [Paenibacillus sp. GCM10027626]|uniref:HAAS signaling domain-containing protein n=1 Tax=Paenibacillus sp. GCM10027626 TaxID=3273411 RepID=UPI003639CE22